MTHPRPQVILHVPHASEVVPEDLLESFLLSADQLEDELLAMTDHFTDQLFDLPGRAERIIYPVSRLVVDPERFMEDSLEVMTSRGMGVIYTKTSTGVPLREAVTGESRRELLDRFYTPHHRALSEAVSAGLRTHGCCLILDCHSFPSIPRPYELDQRPHRPDVCIGTDPLHSPDWLVDTACTWFREAGFSVDVDRPFAGTIVPMEYYGHNRRVLSVMIELNRALYMDEETAEKLPEFEEVRGIVSSILARLAQLVADFELATLEHVC